MYTFIDFLYSDHIKHCYNTGVLASCILQIDVLGFERANEEGGEGGNKH